MRQQQKLAGLYLRLSRDDGGDSESNSISNQREMLLNFCKQNLLPIYSEYIDDGVSGTTFERSGFKQMVSDITDGKIGTVIVKDLSRLGRNNALVSYYTDIFFLENNIRFIAINDNIDSAKGEDEIMGFRSVINEFYARDISKKIKSVKANQVKNGKRIGGKPPLGYMVDPNDKHKNIINPETAPIVKRMFEMAANGESLHSIAKTFTLEKIPSPLDMQNGTYTGIEWGVSSIHRMLKNKTYLGCMVYNRHPKLSFKSQKRIVNAESDWIITSEQHEPLVDEELFELVQKRIAVKKRHNSWDIDNVFQGIVKCVDCGSNLGLARNSREHESNGKFYLCCYKYRRYSKENRCTMHYIKYKLLYELVLAEIRENIAVVNANWNRIEEVINKALAKEKSKVKSEEDILFTKLTRRRNELDKAIERLFEGSALNSLSTERFHEMLAKYESERVEVVTRLEKFKTTHSEKTEDRGSYKQFFAAMRKYKGETELTATMVNELIERIVVHESNGGKLHREQQVDIHYKFIDGGLTGLAESSKN